MALRYWREIVIGALIIVIAIMGMGMFAKNAEIAVIENERDQYKSALEYQNDTLLREGERYEEKIKALPKEITKIHNRYEVIYRDIQTWEGDENASDCDDADRFLRSFNY